MGDAWAAFNEHIETPGGQMQEMFVECLNQVTGHVVPTRVPHDQKRHMQHLKKPHSLKAHQFVAHAVEMNMQLNECLPFEDNQHLSSEESKDLLDAAVPVPWQLEMQKDSFNSKIKWSCNLWTFVNIFRLPRIPLRERQLLRSNWPKIAKPATLCKETCLIAMLSTKHMTSTAPFMAKASAQPMSAKRSKE